MGIGERHSLLCHVQAVLVELYGLPIGGVILQQTGLLSNEDFYHEREIGWSSVRRQVIQSLHLVYPLLIPVLLMAHLR